MTIDCISTVILPFIIILLIAFISKKFELVNFLFLEESIVIGTNEPIKMARCDCVSCKSNKKRLIQKEKRFFFRISLLVDSKPIL